MKVMLANVRLAFPNLFQAKAMPGGGPAAFSASLIFPPNHPQLAEVEAAMAVAANQEWGAKGPAMLASLKAQKRLALKLCDATDPKNEYAGFADNYYISARSKTKPLLLDREKNEVSEASGIIYAGCIGNASLEFWPQDHPSYGKRINCQIRGFQKTADADAFGGGTRAAASEFADLADTGEVTEIDPLS